MDILRSPLHNGFPTDYYLSRIRGRRVALIQTRENYSEATAAIISRELWPNLQREMAWNYRQMNKRKRATFAPVFFYFELRTLILCLRKLPGSGRERINEILADSLMHEDLIKILLQKGTVDIVFQDIIGFFSILFKKFAALSQAYATGGLGSFEETLYRVFLEEIGGKAQHHMLLSFFQQLIDIRNIITLHKHLRWKIQYPPHFSTNGDIPVKKITNILANQDTVALHALVLKFAGNVKHDLSELTPEIILYQGLARRLRRFARQPEAEGKILEYLWQYHTETKNLSLICVGREIGQGTVSMELIR